jgi:hypothetical protein
MIVRIASPVTTGGVLPRSIEDRRRTEPRARDDGARAEELVNLRLALATFSLQLDAFELRMREGLFGTAPSPKSPVRGPTRSRPSEGKNHWSSISSHGGRSEG